MAILLCEGLTYKQVGLELGVSASTVRTHINNAYRALGVAGSHQAVVEVMRRGWLGWVPPPAGARPRSFARERPFLHAYLRVIDRAGWPPVPSVHEREAMDAALTGDAAWRAAMHSG